MVNLVVVSAVLPPSASVSPSSDVDTKNDTLDDFNHPRQRRTLILAELERRTDVSIEFRPANPDESESLLHQVYGAVHSPPLIDFLSTAWNEWKRLGEAGRDPIGMMNQTPSATDESNESSMVAIPPLAPACLPLMRCSARQRPSTHVIGQVSYYCTDACTPIFAQLLEELRSDAALVQTVRSVLSTGNDVVYIVPNHPGHHAATDCFGGYCYLNHAAALAAACRGTDDSHAVAVLDVDYHCGNGTAAIFDKDETVLVVSIHCDPDCDYPFHMGFADDSTPTTLHLPLPPGTTWDTYQIALLQGLQRIIDFAHHGAASNANDTRGLQALIVSLGLDTYDHDPCAIRRAGFALTAPDYTSMGQVMATTLRAAGLDASLTQVVFVQEGGYRMDVIGTAAANVVTSFAQHWS